ncbi:MAG: type II toxin-antitoxin system PemK/MazF family toxin [Gammaproteobacteria bacterium]|nr:MAG: type II toxin-antitoxin system PemK/MazF family toxin [Gammaproteobacteria bacterium]RKZ37684.1 MAG: type II toxin-antitoxin system PemK/MazF family toxin [Gammaproteobacteria bacterium]
MPKNNLTYQRGEIRWVNLEPTVGAETQKIRPGLIVQNDIMNQYGLLTIVIPFRSGYKQAPYIVNVKASATNGLDQDSFIDVGQIRAVDHIDVQINHFTKGNHSVLPLPANMLSVGAIPRASPVK